ncbi:MAG: hypothetical protein WC566_05715 [Dehalococcoidia bacterium]
MVRIGTILIVLGIIVIVSLFVVDFIASRQVFGPPYIYEPPGEKWSTYYPERAQGWVKDYRNIHQWLWGIGLPLSIVLIVVGHQINQHKKT